MQLSVQLRALKMQLSVQLHVPVVLQRCRASDKAHRWRFYPFGCERWKHTASGMAKIKPGVVFGIAGLLVQYQNPHPEARSALVNMSEKTAGRTDC